MPTLDFLSRISTLFGAAPSAAETDSCPICIETLDSKTEIHETSCGHKFHSKCYIKHLLTEDIRCPLCRKYPDPTDYRNGDATMTSSLDERGEVNTRVSRNEAWTNARKSSDKRVKQSLVTIKKWKNEASKARATLVQTEGVLHHKKQLIDEKVNLFHRKLTAEHEYQHATEIAQMKKAEQDLARANQVKMRLLVKFGYRRYRFSRIRRRRRL
jgi:hypothetical protein